MVEYSVGCLKNLAVDEVCTLVNFPPAHQLQGSVEELIDEGVIDTLRKIQQLNPYNEKIQEIVRHFVS